jgi:putative ABC transport system permease protein
VVARIALPRAAYGTPASVQQFAERFGDELLRIPGVRRAGGVNVAPLSGVLATINFTVEGRPPRDPRDIPSAHYRVITDTCLDALGVPLLRGRGFAATDGPASPPVALVSRRLAEAVFGSGDPIGARLLVDDTASGSRPLLVVGVIGDIRQTALDAEPGFEVYVPMRQANPDIVQWLANNQFWVIETAGDVPDIVVRTRAALQKVDARVGVAHVRPLSEYVDAALVQRRFATTLSAALAAVALALVVVGLYGVIAYSVSQRTREIGLRAALGATRGDVWWLVTRAALGTLAIGAALGLAIAAPALRPLGAVLFRTELFDPALVTGVVATLAAVGVAAAALPAWRAARIDPATALRD